MLLPQVERLGIRHVKGVLLFGPPGTGKTLIARQIGKMLNGKEPKIVNGPEVLNKFVGALCSTALTAVCPVYPTCPDAACLTALSLRPHCSWWREVW